MATSRVWRHWASGFLAAGTMFCVLLPVTRAAQPAGQPASQPSGPAARDSGAGAGWSDQLWRAALGGDQDKFYDLIAKAPKLAEGKPAEANVAPDAPAADKALPDKAGIDPAAASANRLAEGLAKREETRAKRIGEIRAEIDKKIADANTDINISKALVSAIELHMISIDKAAVLAEPAIVQLISRADGAARSAESRGDWLMASELFFRLELLLEQTGKYRDDSDRQGRRLEMIRLYAPQRLWELRNARLKAEGTPDDKLPPYNNASADYKARLASVDSATVVRAVARSAKHVEQVPGPTVIIGGLNSVRTLATTTDLVSAFPGLGDKPAVDKFVAYIDSEISLLRGARNTPMDVSLVDSELRRLTEANATSVNLPAAAILHEFGNGAMNSLDEHSKIIWPDELAVFQRNTQGKFVGVGVQIEFNEQSYVRVVSPLEGTPAQRAGIRTGDLIKFVDGKDVFGLTLDQVVDLITGPANTKVTLGIERTMEDGSKAMIDKPLIRAIIEVKSVKGWKRHGVAEDDWDWFIDPVAKIGYARITGFTDTTTAEFDRAISAMQAQGMSALILDLRFNPGGLLDQAVSIANRFIDRGPIVMTRNSAGQIENQRFAESSRAVLAHVPTVVLVNESSASASEIVSGALQVYAHRGQIDCIIMGQRSFGKGSVQDVYPLGSDGAMKLTTQYYMLPDRRIIHRKPGATTWGIEPDIAVEMLPAQSGDAIILRKNADVLPLDEFGKIIKDPKTPTPDPQDLLDKGLDLQLGAALTLLQTRAHPGKIAADSTTRRGTGTRAD